MKLGKGVFSKKEFYDGETIFIEYPLVCQAFIKRNVF